MRSKKLKLIVGAMLVTMVGATFVGCGSSEGANSDSNVASISISGSTSVGPLMEKIQEKYAGRNDQVTMQKAQAEIQ